MRIIFDKNVPVGVRRFLSEHEVRTFVEMEWHPQLENSELLKAAEASGFDVKMGLLRPCRGWQDSDCLPALTRRATFWRSCGADGRRIILTVS